MTFSWRLAVNLALILLASVVGFVLAELGARLYLANKGVYSNVEFRAVAVPYGDYHPDFGVIYAPHTSFDPVFVRNSSVVGCLGPVSAANRDGFRGRTTLSEYQGAPEKLVLVGDSFSDWRQDGVTWPDLFEDRMRDRWQRQVAVLNLAVGGYGILQMVDVAAWAAEQYRPHAVVIAFVSDDLTRGRWWKRIEQIDGLTRPLMSSRPQDFSLAVSRDELLVHPAATQEWCRKHLGSAAAPELSAMLEQYRHISDSLWRARGQSPPSFWSLTESVIVNQLVHGHAFKNLMHSLPRVTFRSFRNDDGFIKGVERLKRSGAQLFLVHLPVQRELNTRQLLLSGQARSLWNSLEESFGAPVSTITGRLDRERIPDRLDLTPIDPHPNLDGLRFYAERVADLFTERVNVPSR